VEPVKIVLSILRNIIPKRYEGESDESFRWRSWACVLQIVAYLVIFAHIAWAMGYLVKLGIEGPPKSKDIIELNTTMGQIKTRLDRNDRREKFNQMKILEQDLLHYRTMQCKSVKDKNEDAKVLTNEKMQELEDEYYQIEQRVWITPPCESLL